MEILKKILERKNLAMYFFNYYGYSTIPTKLINDLQIIDSKRNWRHVPRVIKLFAYFYF